MSFDRVTELGIDAIKVHPLHIVKDTQMTRQRRKGQVRELTMEACTDVLAKMITRVPAGLLFNRLTGGGEWQYLLSPQWTMHKWDVLGMPYKKLEFSA